MTDADNEDDGLKSLRAVWLSMPDEDPPERGLADLMAAARVKATEMTAKPSLWQRFLDSMRRPPVLALATVMVLIGGAVLVSNRSKDMDAQPTVGATEERASATTTVTDRERDEGGASAGSAVPEPAPAEAPAPVVGGIPEAQLEAKAAEEPKAMPAPKKRPEPRGGSTRAFDDLAKAKDQALPKSATTEATKSAKQDSARSEDAMLFDSDGEAEAPKQEVTTRPTRGAGATAAPPRTEAPADSGALSSTPSVAQLHQSARAAAARGDCDAARRITSTIAKQDPAYYKAKVANDASVSRCVLAQ